MLRFLSRVLLVAVFLLLLIAVTGPLFINPNPAPASTPTQIDPVRATHAFVTLPVAEHSGLRLHYRDSTDPRGDNLAPLKDHDFLLLHGFTFNLSTWDALFDFFAREGRTIAYDQLPYGLSEKPLPSRLEEANPYAKSAAIEQLLHLMDVLEMEHAVLVGNSAGGTLALEVARRAPERVAALILISPWIYANRPTFPTWLVESPQMRRISLLLARQLGAKLPLLDLSYAHPERITEERRALAASHTWTPGWDLAWGALMNRSLMDAVTVSEALPQIEQPTLMLAGAEDHLIEVGESARAAKQLPHAEFAVLPDCGHTPQEECPDLVKAVIADWLRQLWSSQSEGQGED